MAHYLILFSMAKPNKATAEKVIRNLGDIATGKPNPCWIDPAYAGIPVETDLIASEIWNAAIKGIDHQSDLRDLLIVELGSDWCARQDTPATNWLATHLGAPHRR